MRFASSLLALSLTLSASLLPAAAHAEDAGPKPTVETSPRWVLVGAGAGVFAVSYGVSAFVAATSQGATDVDHSAYLWMAVPVVGPFVTAGVAPLKRDEKVLLGQGDVLSGRLLTYDSLKMKFRELRLRRDVDCPVCSDKPRITEYVDYEGFCTVGA